MHARATPSPHAPFVQAPLGPSVKTASTAAHGNTQSVTHSAWGQRTGWRSPQRSSDTHAMKRLASLYNARKSRGGFGSAGSTGAPVQRQRKQHAMCRCKTRRGQRRRWWLAGLLDGSERPSAGLLWARLPSTLPCCLNARTGLGNSTRPSTCTWLFPLPRITLVGPFRPLLIGRMLSKQPISLNLNCIG